MTAKHHYPLTQFPPRPCELLVGQQKAKGDSRQANPLIMLSKVRDVFDHFIFLFSLLSSFVQHERTSQKEPWTITITITILLRRLLVRDISLASTRNYSQHCFPNLKTYLAILLFLDCSESCYHHRRAP